MAAPLHLSFRFDRKAQLSMLAISLCVAYVAGGYAVAAAFEHSTRFLGDTFEAEFHLAPDGPPESGWTRVFATRADVAGTPRVVVALEGQGALQVSESTVFVLPGQGLWEDDRVELEGPGGRVDLVAVETRRQPVWEPGWLLVSKATLARLDPRAVEAPVFAYAGVETDAGDGYGAPAVLHFFLRTGGEVARDVWLILAFAGVIVAVVAGEFMRLEIVEKRREIGIWRALGLSRRGVLQVLLLRVVAVAGVGSLFGSFLALLALGAMPLLSAGLASVTESVLVSLPLATLVVVAAALLGALPPALRASRASVARLLEVRA